MYLLRCPEGHEIPVAASAAGGTVVCPVCGQSQLVPTLGELRRLPEARAAGDARGERTTSVGARIAFAVLMFVALGAAASATFAAFRWQSLPIPMTVEDHIAGSQEVMGELTAAQLVDVWQMHEQHNPTTRTPYPYQLLADERAHWRAICFGSLAVVVVSILLGVVIISLGKSRRPAADT
ncbi:hypothetical protein [Candidatus Laterigemmans baculatus]|uniref:hypothetical protein n=1 Tax=Candidatus Laterigemmans baculatus TaxID=2770505 RepID=UPI0013DA371C|nr:hypothetical protein [Candidatus Laterigemmans baculatus]